MSEVRIYKGRKDGRLSDRDAAVFGRFIEKRFEDGRVTANELVSAARAKRSPIHGYFEWDDVRAADEFRLEQARDYLRSIEVVVQTKKGEEQTRAFHVISNGGRAYVAQEIVFSTPEYREQVIERARREAEGWVRRYEQYEELAGVRLAIADALAA